MRGTTPSLPEDIIEENILTRLPVKSIARFRCVSKTWHLLFRSPNFIKTHLNHAILMNKFNILVTHERDDMHPTEGYLYCIDNNALSSAFLSHPLIIEYPFMLPESAPLFIGSCNGLVCIESFLEDIYIWNPATREYKLVPKPSVGSEEDYFNFVIHGFGFDCKNHDYKVLEIVGIGEGKVTEARVYSLASDSWKELGFIPYDFAESYNNGFHLNGVLYWVATLQHSGLKSTVILCYNISDETFHEVPLPIKYSDEDEDAPSMPDLGIWEGKLCLLSENHIEDPDTCTHLNDHIDVWTMVDNKWKKHLKITAQMADMSYRRPIQTLHNGEILLQGGPRGEEGTGLMSYNSNLERARALKIHNCPNMSDVVTYIETLVALNSGTYVGQ